MTNGKHSLPRIAFVYKLSIKEPLGIAYLSAYLKARFPGIPVAFFDPKVDDLRSIRDFAPNLVLYSIMSGQYRENVRRNLNLKQALPPYLSVFGGPHPTYFPDMIEDEGVDIVCRGEGEHALASLVQALLEGDDITGVQGLWVKRGATIYKNDFESLISDLDSLPFPDRDLFYDKSPLFRGRIAKSVFTARGCPFRCTYCYNSSLNLLVKGKGRVRRYRSPTSVVAEIRQLQVRYPLPFVLFGEDVFAGVKLDWLKEFDDLYKDLRIPYNVSIRAELVTSECVRYLKKSGCASVCLAIEHGGFDYRKKYLDRHMTNEQLLGSIRMLESAGIRVATPTMIGLPYTSLEDDFKTLELVCEARPTFGGATIFQPYPGLPLTEICLKDGLIDRNFVDRLNTDCYQSAHIKGIDYARVSKLRRIFGILRVLGYYFPRHLRNFYKFIPDIFVVYQINNFLNFIYFNKFYDYSRGFSAKWREIFVGLDTGAFGVRLRGLGRKEKF
ncbi:MAG: hypothetical protein HW380_811 [Magnetococcales bacterium]|nr:hypothetical protein [Magnetococcales bacterium]HIJ85493.1 B12-binding domain-containing radical SAM protein [Magnetococcales bacterium]